MTPALIWQKCQRHPWFVTALAASLLTLPLFFFITPTLNDNDLSFYKVLLQEFSRQLWHGERYPRWLYAANDGVGSPVFLFYGPLSFYFASLLEWMSPADPFAIDRFIISVTFARIITGWLCYRWLRKHCNGEQALVITLLYMTLPYIVHEIYVRTAIAEQWALIWNFTTLMALDRMREGRRCGFVAVTLSLALLILTHAPSFVTFSWVSFVYVYFMPPRDQWQGNVLKLFAAYALALGLTGIYLLPLAMNKDFVQSSIFISGQYHFSHNFINNINEILSLPYFALCVLALVRLAKPKRGDEAGWPFSEGLRNFFISVLGLVVFLLLPLSMPLWWLLLPLHYLQFPFRFLMVALLPFACFAGYLAMGARFRPLVLMVWIIALILHGYMVFGFAPHDEAGFMREVATRRLIVPAEYHTIWNHGGALWDRNQGQLRIAEKEGGSRRVIGKSVYIVLPGRDDEIRVELHLTDPAAVSFRWRYFPGVRVQNLVSGAYIDTRPDTPEGFLTVDLPPGDYKLRATYGPFKGEREGKWLSLLSLAVLLMTILPSLVTTRVKQESA